MRRTDAHGDTIPRPGDIVVCRIDTLSDDPGTVTKILQSNGNGAQCVAVRWFVWDNGRTTEEYVSELRIISEV
jgi:hypothetical protein